MRTEKVSTVVVALRVLAAAVLAAVALARTTKVTRSVPSWLANPLRMYVPRRAVLRGARNETLSRLRDAGAATGVVGVGSGVASGASVSISEPMYRSRFGDPGPASVTRLRDATEDIVVLASSAEVLRVLASWRAMAPATCGAAIEVPDSVLVAEVEVHHADVMSCPGAKRSTHEP